MSKKEMITEETSEKILQLAADWVNASESVWIWKRIDAEREEKARQEVQKTRSELIKLLLSLEVQYAKSEIF